MGHFCELVLVEGLEGRVRWRGGGGRYGDGDGGGENVQVSRSWRGTLEERLKGVGG